MGFLGNLGKDFTLIIEIFSAPPPPPMAEGENEKQESDLISPRMTILETSQSPKEVLPIALVKFLENKSRKKALSKNRWNNMFPQNSEGTCE